MRGQCNLPLNICKLGNKTWTFFVTQCNEEKKKGIDIKEEWKLFKHEEREACKSSICGLLPNFLAEFFP